MMNAQAAGSSSDLGFSTLSRFLAGSDTSAAKVQARQSSRATAQAGVALSPAELQDVARLRATDRAVRAHEQAHLAVGGDLVRGGANFSYTTGPDSKRYAVAGEVSIDVSPGRTPQETLPKAAHIRATALAPADPSPQDHSVAAHATQMEQQARIDLAAERQAEAAHVFYAPDGRAESNLAGLGARLDQYA